MNRSRYTPRISEKNIILFIVILVYSISEFLSFQNGLFWDSITILSKPATFLFENGIFNFHYPASYDNGDPQLVPFYISLIWKIFGRNLLATHLAFLPVVATVLTQTYRLTSKLFPSQLAPYIFMLISIDPTLISQSIGIYQDGFVILFSLLIINAMIDRSKIRIMLFMLLLCMVSRRGILLTSGFMLGYFINLIFIEKKSLNKIVTELFVTCFPAILFVLAFIVWRLSVFNWFFTTEQTNTGKLVTLEGFVKNILVLVRWFFDDGRLFLWVLFTILFLKQRNKKYFFKNNRFITIIFISLCVVIMAVTLSLANPFGARYFVVQYILFAILLSKLLIATVPEKTSKRILITACILLFSGNFWVYPETLSQSWDSSLGHLPYFELRKNTIGFFNRNKVDFHTVGVGFPMYASSKYIDITNDTCHFEGIDFKRNKWIVYSNIFNLTDEEIQQCKSWILVDEFQRGSVFMKIYKNPNYNYEP
jgi:hypothetical protein